jgi:nucleotide-binding universal stress UspA family protein
MICSSILCPYSGEASRGSALKHAIKLAKEHDAHITGVMRHGRPLLERRFAAQIPEHLLQSLHDADNVRAKEVADRFKTMTADAGLSEQSEFLDLKPEINGPMAEFARSFDLIVTGAHTVSTDDDAHLSANPDMLALQSGRPVIVVPDGYETVGLASRALVAWDGKRSAARAIGDALVGLSGGVSVTLLSVKSTPKNTDQLVQNMKRHGIEVAARTVDRKGSIADTILREAEKDDVRLVVMGAFEHSKFSHDLFGGVTTDVIYNSKVPVFMAH